MATQYNVTYASDGDDGITTAYAYEYDRDYISAISEYIVWPSFGDEYSVPKNMGDQVKVHRLTALTVDNTAGVPTALTEATPPDGQYIVKTAVYLDVVQYGEAVFVSDRLEFQDADSNISIAMELLGEWTANVLDYSARAELCGGSNVWYLDDSAGSVDGANTAAVDGAVSVSLLEQMIRYADDNKMRPWKPAVVATDGVGTTPVPKGIPVIISSKHKFDLRMLVKESGGFVPAHLYPSQDRIHQAEIGSYDCLRFVMTDNPQIELDAGSVTGAGTIMISDDDTNCDVHSMVMVGRHSYAVGQRLALDLQDDKDHAFVEIIAKGLGSAGTKDPIDQVASVGVKFYDITGLLITEHVLEVQTAVTIDGTLS